MATNASPLPDATGGTDLNSIGDKRSDIPHHAQVLGPDGSGAVHYHSPRADRVWVVDPDPDSPVASVLTHDQYTPDIWAWIDHTTECRGAWRDLRYDRGSAFANIIETIAEAQR